jgi:hypothetical protein
LNANIYQQHLFASHCGSELRQERQLRTNGKFGMIRVYAFDISELV